MCSEAYGADLAYIHDQGFTEFARASAPGVLTLLRHAEIDDGTILDVGCGSGVWASELVRAGYDVQGLDLSPSMIELARSRVPSGSFTAGSFLDVEFPTCSAITALGEVFNYLFDSHNGLDGFRRVCQKAWDAMLPGGLLIFDVAAPGRSRGLAQSFREGPDWTCLVEYRHDQRRQQLTRRIVTFRRIDSYYRRDEETHQLQLFGESFVRSTLEDVGFVVDTIRSYGDYALPEALLGYVARRPHTATFGKRSPGSV